MKYVYKAISALCALAILPLLVFAPIIYYYVSSVALQGLFTLAELMGSEAYKNAMERHDLTSIPEGIADTFSLYEIADLVERFGGKSDSDILEKIDILIPPFFAMLAAFVCIVVCAIVTVVLAIACKDNRKVIASSIAGIASSFLFVELFDNLVAPILSGTISLSTFLNSLLASLLGEIEKLEISSSFYIIPLIFGFIIFWTVVFNATLPEKEKVERRKMIG